MQTNPATVRCSLSRTFSRILELLLALMIVAAMPAASAQALPQPGVYVPVEGIRMEVQGSPPVLTVNLTNLFLNQPLTRVCHRGFGEPCNVESNYYQPIDWG